MAVLANVQPVVRNTFWDLDSDNATEELPCRPRSYSDCCVDYRNADHKVDFSDSTTIADTNVDHKVDFCDLTTTAGTSRAGSEVGSDDGESWAEIMSGEPWSQIMSGPPGVFCQPTSVQVQGTAVMVRHIPGDTSVAAFLEALDSAGFAQMYDFVYVPMDFRKGVRLGYAIVNFVEPASAAAAMLHLSNMELGGNRLNASLSEANQHLSDLIQKYRDSAVMHWSVPEDCKPILFSEGQVLPFPRPTKVLEPPSQAKAKKSKKRAFP